jgi:predicted metal-dependent phosphoesterase TrpH
MTPLFRADLHCHTICSDGSLSPKEILHLAAERGLNALSITDHDTGDAYDEALSLAKELGIEMISGVEFSALHKGEGVHVLGYAYQLAHPGFEAFCERHHQRRVERNRLFIDKLATAGMEVSEQDLYQMDSDQLPRGRQTVGRPHIAKAMMQKGYVTSINHAFRKYIGDRAPLFVEGRSFSVEETLEVIHKAGGYAVIAHPHFIKKRKILRDLFEMPFDGLEAYYACLPCNQEGPWAKKAEELGWFYTGGSDFHGDPKPHIRLGASWTKEETFRMLQTRYRENNPDDL